MDGEFTELHANAMVVAASEREVKSRAKAELLQGKNTIHTDDLFDIDDCLELTSVDGYGVSLTPTEKSLDSSATTDITSFRDQLWKRTSKSEGPQCKPHWREASISAGYKQRTMTAAL